MSIKNNISSLQEVLNTINSLPEAGTDLPELSNEGTASDLLSGKQLIDGEGNVVNGAFTIDEELTTQDNLIAQIQTALEGKAAGSEPTLQEKTVSPTTSSQTVTPDSGYDGLSKVTVNAILSAETAVPQITVSTSGLITARNLQEAGYVEESVKTATKQLTTQGAQTITPSTSDKTISSGRYLTGTQTIKGDSNLIASNIKSGVSIFGVNGSYEGSGSSGDSGGIDTCSLTISGDFQFIYSVVSSGNIIGESFTSPEGEVITVPCSSLVTVYDYQMMSGIQSPLHLDNVTTIYDGTAEYGLMSVFQVSSVANSECTLSFEDGIPEI